MGLKPGYKLTDAGVIPEEWEVSRLDSLGAGSVPAIKAGPFGSALTKDTYVPTGYKVYGQEQVIRGDYLYGDYYISPTKFRELESCAVSPGDVLLTLVGTAGKVLVVPDDAPAGVINPRLIRFSFDKKRVCPQFFKELFEGRAVQGFLARYAQGGTMGVLNASMLRTVNIPLPPLPEQRAIAGALSDVDALISAQEKLIAKKRDLKQATMQQLLTGKQRLPGFRGEWEVKRLGEIFQVLSTANNPRADLSEFGDVGYVHYGDIHTHSSAFLDCGLTTLPLISRERVAGIPLVQDGDLVMADASEDYEGIGKCVEVQNIQGRDIVAGLHTFLLRGDKRSLADGYKGYLQFTPTVKAALIRMATGISVYGVSKSNVKNIEVLLPRPEEQTAIATVLSDMDTEIAVLEEKRDKTRLLKQGMMQELLTGKTRLVDSPRSHE